MKRELTLVLFFLAGTAPAWAATAQAVMAGTTPESKGAGWVTLRDAPEGLSIEVNLENAAPGLHGFHIHENGSCEDQGNAAGGHYNPLGAPHGFVPADGLQGAHAGDFGNVEIGPDGKGALALVIPGLTVTGGEHNVENRALILHEKQDDFGQPTGNAGARVACGVIQVTG